VTPFELDASTRATYDSMVLARNAGMIHLRAEDDRLDGRLVHIDGRPFRNFVSCSYLGLELDARVIAAVQRGAADYGATFSVSRAFISAPRYQALEASLARMTGTHPVITASTTLGHFALLTSVIQTGDVLLLDQQVHATVHMAAKVVADRARIVTVRHNAMERLDREITRQLADPATKNVWYLGDGIYSMHGDAAPMPELLALLQKHDRLHVYLDDAHGTGTFGAHGRGLALGAQASLHPRMVVALSLGKAFGMGIGGALCFASPAMQDLVRTCGMPMIFCAPLPPPVIEGCIAAADIYLSAEYASMHAELRERIARFRSAAEEAGLTLSSHEHSPVQYVTIGDLNHTLAAACALRDAGFLVNPCGYPAVARNHSGIRQTITRHQTLDDIDALVGALAEAIAGASLAGASA
jgi:7-keto-8-aminopelargonate synthetase-like enzyme